MALTNLLEVKMKIKVKTVNVITGEEEIIERDLTEQEIIERENFEKEEMSRKAEAEAKAAAKAALLAQLGITEEQAKLLLS